MQTAMEDAVVPYIPPCRCSCFFVITANAEKEKLKQEDYFVLNSSITTLLFILWHKDHYAVIRVDIELHMVTLWDAFFTPNMDRVKEDMISYWQKHINYALALHLHNQVMENYDNIVSLEDANANNTPLWEEGATNYPV